MHRRPNRVGAVSISTCGSMKRNDLTASCQIKGPIHVLQLEDAGELAVLASEAKID